MSGRRKTRSDFEDADRDTAREMATIVAVVEMILERIGPAELLPIADKIDRKLHEVVIRHVEAGRPTEASASFRLMGALRRACPPRLEEGRNS